VAPSDPGTDRRWVPRHRPDLRGRGRTQRPERVGDYRLTSVVQDVKALLDQLGLEKVHVMGHDFSPAVAWMTASLLRERVDLPVTGRQGLHECYLAGRR
jgi:pimeloyl-ACP methyl ester carboxylesterase